MLQFDRGEDVRDARRSMAVAVGADGLIIEVHPNPEEAFSDGQQSLLPEEFSALMQGVRKYLDVEGKTL